jgi:hypothetical protein
MSNFNYPNSRIYSGHYMPVLIDFNFIVDSTNGNGLGQRSLKGAYVKNVYMHTSASFTGNTHTSTLVDGISGGTASLLPNMPVSGSGIPAGCTIASIVSSSSITLSAATTTTVSGDTISYAGVGSPNPAAGNIMVQLAGNYNRVLFSNIGDIGPLSGSNIAVDSTLLTVGQAYIITVVGTSTAADWVTLGVPVGVTPAPGVAFIALVTGTGSGSGQVQLSSNSGITKYQGIGDPNQSIAPMSTDYSTSVIGSWLQFQCLAATSSSVTTLIPTAPANGTVIGIQCWMSNSPFMLGGQ